MFTVKSSLFFLMSAHPSLLCGRFTVQCAATESVSSSTWRRKLVCVSSALIPYTEVRPEFGLIQHSLPHISYTLPNIQILLDTLRYTTSLYLVTFSVSAL